LKLKGEALKKKRLQLAEARKKIRHNKVSLDPKKQAFLNNYYNPESETYSNKFRSALKAGFSESYSRALCTPSFDTKWVKIENWTDASSMTPQHIVTGFERIALQSSKEENKIKALENLAKMHGMMVEKKLVGHVNIEDLLNNTLEDVQLDEPDQRTTVEDTES
jgi:hypothetical protein